MKEVKEGERSSDFSWRTPSVVIDGQLRFDEGPVSSVVTDGLKGEK